MVYTTQYLVDLFGIETYMIETKYIQDSPMDITLMIGKDWVKKGIGRMTNPFFFVLI